MLGIRDDTVSSFSASCLPLLGLFPWVPSSVSPPSGSHPSPSLRVSPSAPPVPSDCLSAHPFPAMSTSVFPIRPSGSLPIPHPQAFSPLSLLSLSLHLCSSLSLPIPSSAPPISLYLSFSFQRPICLLLSPLGFLLPLRSSVLLPTLRVCLSLGFFLCPFVCSLRASFSVRPSPDPPPPPPPFSLGQPFPPLPSSPSPPGPPSARTTPLFPGGAPVGLRGPHSLSPALRAPGLPSAGRRAFFLPPAPALPPPGPSPSRPCCGPAGFPEPPPRRAAGLRGGGARRRPQKLLCKEAGRGAGPHGPQPPGRRGAGAHPGPRRRPAPAARPLGAYLGARCPPPAARARPGRAARTSASARPRRPCSLRAWPCRPGVRACGARGPLRPAARRALLAAGSSATARAPGHRAGAADELTAVRSLARGCRGRGSARGRPMGAGRRAAGGGAGAGVGGAPSRRSWRQVVGWGPGPAPVAAGCSLRRARARSETAPFPGPYPHAAVSKSPRVTNPSGGSTPTSPARTF